MPAQIAASGSEALAHLSHDVPDVLVSDVGIPHVDGYELIRSVRERGVSVPAIALTAYGRSEDETRARSAGYQIHMPKPVLPSQLLACVAALAAKEPV